MSRNPAKSFQNAAAEMREGKRSGVVVSAKKKKKSTAGKQNNEPLLEDIDLMFASARTTRSNAPKPTKPRTRRKNKSRQRLPTAKLKISKAVSVLQSNVRLSLVSGAGTEETKNEDESTDSTADASNGSISRHKAISSATKPSTFLTEISTNKKKTKNVSWRDIDTMSPVATQPPTPTPPPPPQSPAEEELEAPAPTPLALPPINSPLAEAARAADDEDKNQQQEDLLTQEDFGADDLTVGDIEEGEIVLQLQKTPEEKQHPTELTDKDRVSSPVDSLGADSSDLLLPPDDNDDDEGSENGIEDDLIPPNPQKDTADDSVNTENKPDESSVPDSTSTPETEKVEDKKKEQSTPVEDTQDDDDDKEGPGFDMAQADDDADYSNTPVTPPRSPAPLTPPRTTTTEEEETDIEQKKASTAKSRGRKKGGKKKRDDASTVSSEMETPKPKKSRKRIKANPPTLFSPPAAGNRQYRVRPAADFVEPSPDDANLRRSNRLRHEPLAFWKNEKFIYGAHEEEGELAKAMGDMPVVKGVQEAQPTPKRPRKAVARTPAQTGRQKKKANAKSTAPNEVTPYDSRKIRKKRQIIKGEMAELWDDSKEEVDEFKVISYASKMRATKMPLPPTRKASEGRVTGSAAQAFNVEGDDDSNYVGFIMGTLVLPPRGIKDAESVGPCSQTFTICTCQPGSLEVSYNNPNQRDDGMLDAESAQRFLLGPGDLFQVPPGNSYRLENHSPVSDCTLTWTIIRPRERTAQDDQSIYSEV